MRSRNRAPRTLDFSRRDRIIRRTRSQRLRKRPQRGRTCVLAGSSDDVTGLGAGAVPAGVKMGTVFHAEIAARELGQRAHSAARARTRNRLRSITSSPAPRAERTTSATSKPCAGLATRVRVAEQLRALVRTAIPATLPSRSSHSLGSNQRPQRASARKARLTGRLGFTSYPEQAQDRGSYVAPRLEIPARKGRRATRIWVEGQSPPSAAGALAAANEPRSKRPSARGGRA
jgi:hypothetical protein